jgi:hypothetical protein
MNKIKSLNKTLNAEIDNENFITEYQRRVRKENMKIVQIDNPLDILVKLMTENDSLVNAASILVDLEHPTPYLLIDTLSIYIETDSRFEHIRKNTPFLGKEQ